MVRNAGIFHPVGRVCEGDGRCYHATQSPGAGLPPNGSAQQRSPAAIISSDHHFR